MKAPIHKILKALTIAVFIASIHGCGNSESDLQEVINAHLERSKAYQKQRQFKAAIIEVRNIIKKDRENTLGYQRLAELYMELGNSRGAYKTLEPIISKTSPTDLQLLLAEAYVKSRKYNSAEKILSSYTEAGGNPDNRQFQFINSQIQVGKTPEKGLPDLIAVTKQYPDLIEAKSLLTHIYLSSKQYDQASTVINQLLLEAPSDPTSNYLAALLSYSNNNLDAAEKYLTESLIQIPDADIIPPLKAQVLTLLSRVLTEQGRTSEALIYSKVLASENPEANAAKGKLNQALQQLKSGELAAAETILEELTNDYPQHRLSAVYLGLVNFHQGDFEEAEIFLNRHLDPETDTPQIIETAAKTKLQLKKNKEALLLLEEALASYPNNEKLLALYGLTALKDPDTEQKGIVALEKVAAQNPNFYQARIALANHYVGSNKAEIGLAQYEKIIENNPENLDITAHYIQAAMESNQGQLADNTIKELLERSPNDINAINLAARYALSAQKPTLASRHYLKALKLDPKNVEALLGMAQLSTQDQKFPEAKRYYQSLIATMPNLALGYKGLITVHELSGTRNQAETEMERYIGLYKKQTAVPLYVMAEYHLRRKSPTLAEKTVKQATELHLEAVPPQLNSALSYQLAKEAFETANYAKARSELIEALQYGIAEPQLLSLLAETEMKDNNAKEAENIVDQLHQKYPQQAFSEVLQGKIAVQKKLYGEANKAFRLAWGKEQSDTTAQQLYASLTLNQETKAAQDFLQEWITAIPSSGRALSELAVKEQAQGNYKQAMKLFEQAVSYGYQNPLVLNNLAWLYQERNDSRASQTAARAYELAPNNYAIVDTYGWILFKEGQTLRAVELLEKASKLAPDSAEIQSHLEQARKQL